MYEYQSEDTHSEGEETELFEEQHQLMSTGCVWPQNRENLLQRHNLFSTRGTI